MLNHVARIEIIVNGRKASTAAATLAELVNEHDLSGTRVATALNGDFVPEGKRATTSLRSGDRVEIVSARQGG